MEDNGPEKKILIELDQFNSNNILFNLFFLLVKTRIDRKDDS